MKARDLVYDDLGEGTWNLEVIMHVMIFQTFILCTKEKNYNNKIKTTFGPPSPTRQTSTQDPTSDKSQGGPDPRSPLWIRA